MNRVICTLIFALLFVVESAFSQQRTLDEMRHEAYSVLTRKASSQSQQRIAAATPQQLEVLMDHEHLSVIGLPDGNYAVIAKSNSVDPVLGYSDSAWGDDPSPEFLDLLQRMNHGIDSLLVSGTNAKVASRRAKSGRSVEPFITTHWAQNAPYNDLCPMGGYYDADGNPAYARTPTGCVATAAAQVVYYYHVTQLKGSTETYTYHDPVDGPKSISLNFDTISFNYDNLRERYGYWEDDQTEEECAEVAKLMYACGVNCHMQYRVGGSGTILFPLKPHFGLHHYFAPITREDFEYHLDAAAPILLSGFSHMVVVDGYDEEGLVHVNYGWGGLNDGYYQVYDAGFSSAQAIYQGFEEDVEQNGVIYELIYDRVHGNKALAIGMASPDQKELIIPDEVTVDGESYEVKEMTFTYTGSKLDKVVLGKSIKSIPRLAFFSTDIHEVVLYSPRISIGEWAFCNIRLDYFTCYADSLPILDDSFGSTNLSNAFLFVPESMIEEYRNTAPWNEFCNIYKIGESSLPEDVADVEIDGFRYNLFKTGEASLIGYNCKPEELPSPLVLPDFVEYNGDRFVVTSLETHRLFASTSFEEVKLPQHLRSMETQTFASNHSLKRIDLPESLRDAGGYTFMGCSQLEEVIIRSQSPSLFHTFSCVVKDIYCYSIDPPTGAVFEYGDESYFPSVTVHVQEAAIQNYQNSALWKNAGAIVALDDPTPEADDVIIDGNHYALYDNRQATFLRRSDKVSDRLELPRTVKYNNFIYTVSAIGPDAFADDPTLFDLRLYHPLTSIGAGAFRDSDLHRIVSMLETPPAIEDDLEDVDTDRITLMVPEDYIPTYSSTAPWNKFKRIWTPEGLPHDSVDEFVSGDFRYRLLGNGEAYVLGFAGLHCPDTLVIPSEVTYQCFNYEVTAIASKALWCLSFHAVTLPESLREIHSQAFQSCEKLAEVSFPESLRVIQTSAFLACNSLTEVTFSGSLREVQFRAFYKCDNLNEVTILANVCTIGSDVFDRCGSLERVYIYSDSLEMWSAFIENPLTDVYCYTYNPPTGSLPSINTSAAVLHVPAEAIDAYKAVSPWKDFGQIVALDAVVPDSFKDYVIDGLHYNLLSTGRAELSYCERDLQGSAVVASEIEYNGFTYPVTSVRAEAFSGCQISEIILPPTLQTICTRAIQYCHNLKELVIPRSVKRLLLEAVNHCDSLSTIWLLPQEVNNEKAFFLLPIKDFYCYAPYPSGNMLAAALDFASATLHVPLEAIDDYRTAYTWRDFGNIVPLTDEELALGIETLSVDAPAQPSGRYDLQGRPVTATTKRGLVIDNGRIIMIK